LTSGPFFLSDGDWITVADDNDLTMAKLASNKLRIKIEGKC
jgi:hypothetical protein